MKKILLMLLTLLTLCFISLTIFAFPAKENSEITYNDNIYKKEDLSKSTVDWLTKYNQLSDEEKACVNYEPNELGLIDKQIFNQTIEETSEKTLLTE